MASHLLEPALKSDDSSTSTDCEAATCDRKDEEPVQEAMSHTATEVMHAASDEAISHKNCSDQKKGGKNKRQSGLADAGKSAKINNVVFGLEASISHWRNVAMHIC